ncbi:MAG: hypothetical protein PUB39_05460 [Eubacteriales bacterium]|nr:hypothetical protein [Eubacteriales bacterium]
MCASVTLDETGSGATAGGLLYGTYSVRRAADASGSAGGDSDNNGGSSNGSDSGDAGEVFTVKIKKAGDALL